MQKVNLNLIPGSVRPVINVSQYDEGRQFQLALFDGAAAYNLTGKTVVIQGTKADGKGFEYDATYEVNGVPAVAISSNIVTITTPLQMTAAGGECIVDLKVIDASDNSLYSLNFILMVEPAALGEQTDISETELPDIIDAARSSAAAAAQSAQDAEDAAAIAEAADLHPPYIGANGNWYTYNTVTEQYEDSGVDASPNVTVGTTTTLPAGSNATVTNSGTVTDPILNFGVPRGEPGGSTLTWENALNVLDDTVGWTGKNKLPFDMSWIKGNQSGGTWSGNTYTKTGVSFALNPDGTVDASGSNTSTTAYSDNRYYEFPAGTLPAGDYILTGCLAGGAANRYLIAIWDNSSSPGSILFGQDTGSGLSFTITDTTVPYRVVCRVAKSYSITGTLHFEPMIRRAAITDATFEPWHEDVDTCKANQNVLAQVENGATASQQYAQGQYFVRGGLLYKATTTISQGGTFTPGTNCQATTVMAELIALTA